MSAAHNPLAAPQPIPPGPYVHPCEHPGCVDSAGKPVWGDIGFKAAGRLRWWCAAHEAGGRAWMTGEKS